MSSTIVTTVTVAGHTTTTSTLAMGVFSGVGVVGLVAVGLWIHNNKKDEEVFEYNQNLLQKEFNFILNEVKKLQDNIFRKYNVKVDFLDKLSKEAEFGVKMYNKSLIKDPAHNQKYEKIIKDFSTTAQNTIYKLKELESETLEELNKKIDRIDNEFSKIEKSNDLIEDIEIIRDELKKEFNSWEDKYSKVNQYQTLLDNYKQSIKKLEIRDSIDNILDGIEEQSVEIISPTNRLISSINEFREKIKKYDSNYTKFSNITSFSKDKLKMVFESIKLDYGKAKEIAIWSNIYREDLVKLSKLELNDEVQNNITSLQNQDIISKNEFKSIADEINEIIIQKQERAILVEALRDNLNSMGYSVINEESSINKLENGEIIYLDTDEDDYKIMIKLNRDMNLTTRVVRVVATSKERENITSYQREKDREVAKKWCSNYDKLSNLLKVNAIEIDTTLRIEPEDDNLTYIVDKNLLNKRKNKREMKIDKTKYIDSK